MSHEPRSVYELESHPTVRLALEEAWADSLPDDPDRRHEEGGWIYQDVATDEIQIRRAAAGVQAAIDLNHPPIVPGCVVVGKFHTHPNPTAEGWSPGPSRNDRRADKLHGVPDLIRADNGVYHSGPIRRRGGIGGKPGYPD